MRLFLFALASMLAGCGAEARPPVAPFIPVATVAPVGSASAPQAPAVAPAPPLTPEENTKALRARLATDTGTEWAVYVDDDCHEIRHLSPIKPVMFGSGSAEERARAFFKRYSSELHASDEELRVVEGPGNNDPEFVRFEHYLKGTDLPVFLTTSSASFTKEGALYMTQPGFRAGLGALPRRAAISSDAARKSVEAEWRRRCPNAVMTIREFALGVRGERSLPPLLIWQATFDVADDSRRCQAEHIYVDATTGVVAAAY
jgi:hypothetical protein